MQVFSTTTNPIICYFNAEMTTTLSSIRLIFIFFIFFVLNATFCNISAISWQPVLVVEEAGVVGENHRPWASNW